MVFIIFSPHSAILRDYPVKIKCFSREGGKFHSLGAGEGPPRPRKAEISPHPTPSLQLGVANPAAAEPSPTFRPPGTAKRLPANPEAEKVPRPLPGPRRFSLLSTFPHPVPEPAHHGERAHLQTVMVMKTGRFAPITGRQLFVSPGTGTASGLIAAISLCDSSLSSSRLHPKAKTPTRQTYNPILSVQMAHYRQDEIS